MTGAACVGISFSCLTNGLQSVSITSVSIIPIPLEPQGCSAVWIYFGVILVEKILPSLFLPPGPFHQVLYMVLNRKSDVKDDGVGKWLQWINYDLVIINAYV